MRILLFGRLEHGTQHVGDEEGWVADSEREHMSMDRSVALSACKL